MNGETAFILQCNRNSFIEQVMFSREALDASVLLNQPLLFCLSPESLEAGKRFLDEIRWTGKAEGFTLEISLHQVNQPFLFSGVLLQNHIIIIAQQLSLNALPEFPLAAMVQNEVEASFAATPDIPEPETHSEVTVWDLMEEMSRLNNELINTKRELIRKNLELERLQKQLKKG